MPEDKQARERIVAEYRRRASVAAMAAIKEPTLKAAEVLAEALADATEPAPKPVIMKTPKEVVEDFQKAAAAGAVSLPPGARKPAMRPIPIVRKPLSPEEALAKADAKLRAREQELRDRGVTENTILTSGTSVAGSTQRYWQCPLCKRYMDALIEIDGMMQIASPDRIMCASCGCANLDTVEGDYFDPKIIKILGPVIKANYVPPDDPHLLRFIREGQALVDEAGFFAEDAKDAEPAWPRQMTAAMIGCFSRMNTTMERIADCIGAEKMPMPVKRRRRGFFAWLFRRKRA